MASAFSPSPHENYTRNEWGRLKNTLETSEEDWKIHSKRVRKIEKYTRNEWGRWKNTLETSGEDCPPANFWNSFSLLNTSLLPFVIALLRAKILYTRSECGFSSSPLVSSVVFHLLHSFRVWFFIFPTRLECSFSSSSLVWSVVFRLPHPFRV
jgi:hypothetical protein